jgi:hypothetical protein
LTAADIEQARKRYQQADDRIVVQTGNGKRQMSETAEANVINRLSTQWTTAIKPVAELDRQGKIMTAALEAARRGDIAQGAEALLVTFQKILDPTSVVRETEAMRSVSMQSLMNRARGAFQRIKDGGSGLTLAEQEKYARLAQDLIQAQSKGYIEATKERIGRTADRFEIPRDLIFDDYQFGAPAAAPARPVVGSGANNPALPANARPQATPPRRVGRFEIVSD